MVICYWRWESKMCSGPEAPPQEKNVAPPWWYSWTAPSRICNHIALGMEPGLASCKASVLTSVLYF